MPTGLQANHNAVLMVRNLIKTFSLKCQYVAKCYPCEHADHRVENQLFPSEQVIVKTKHG